MAYSEARAFELYAAIEAHGWAMLEALRTITLTVYEADVLYTQLAAIQESVQALRGQQQHGN